MKRVINKDKQQRFAFITFTTNVIASISLVLIILLLGDFSMLSADQVEIYRTSTLAALVIVNVINLVWLFLSMNSYETNNASLKFFERLFLIIVLVIMISIVAAAGSIYLMTDGEFLDNWVFILATTIAIIALIVNTLELLNREINDLLTWRVARKIKRYEDFSIDNGTSSPLSNNTDSDHLPSETIEVNLER